MGVHLLTSEGLQGISEDREQLSLFGHTFSVAFIQDPPFSILKKNNTTGKYEVSGFMKDVIDYLSQSLHFNYTTDAYPDLPWGVGNKNNSEKWTGLVGLLQAGEADIGAAGLTHDPERARVIDFSSTIMIEERRLVYKRHIEYSFLQHVKPLHWTVWVMVAIMAVVTSCFFVTITRYSPKEQHEGSTSSSLGRSVLLFLGAICQQGCDPLPLSLPGRIVHATTYIMALVIYTSYTSVLVSFLSVTKEVQPFADLTDLLKSEQYSVGIVNGTYTLEIIMKSTTEPLVILKQAFSKNPDWIFHSTEDGLKHVRQGNFVFITTKKQALVYMVKGCDFAMGKYQYLLLPQGIGFRKGFPHANSFNYYVKRARETGVLQRLTRKWWSLPPNCDNTFNPISLQQSILPFLLFLGGQFVASLVILFEKRRYHRNNCRQQQRRTCPHT